MKAVKIILGILGVLLLIFFILGLMGPETYEVERSTMIEASPEAIYPHAQHFEKRLAWYPWSEKDPNAENTIEGKDGTVGAVYKWSGNDEVGKGKQTITELKENEMVKTRLQFIEPMEGYADTYVRLNEAEGGTNVSWSFNGENNFVGRAMSFFMDIDGMLGPEFEKGLASLKAIVEKEATAPTYRGFAVNKVSFPATSYLGKREKVNFQDLAAFYGKYFPDVYVHATKDKLEMTGKPSGLYYEWDEKNGMTDVMAAIPLKSLDKAPEGMDLVQLPASDAIVINYYGAYEGSGEAHMAMDEYLKANNMEANSPVIEEYVTDPTKEPDTAKWLTKVIYFPKAVQISEN